ncbi:hypothetical protein EC396_15735 [Lutibacter sp. HS1-25]|nr:hypothetical protein EC396_15735 [Lutibacter sp. HS1-25]
MKVLSISIDDPVARPVYSIVSDEYSKLGLLVSIKTNRASKKGTKINRAKFFNINLISSIIFIFLI